MDIQQIKNQVREVIKYSQKISEPKVDELINNWYLAKKSFIDAFDGEPIYSTEEKVTIDLNEEQKYAKIKDFCHMLQETFPQYNDLLYFVRCIKEDFFNNILSKDFIYKDYHIKSGIKISKAFKEFVPNKSDLYFIQTAASQIIQENKITGYLCLSVHPLDYLSSSENNNNWRSCHALDGEYRAGNLSYMLDSSTIVCYICGDSLEKLPRFPESVPWNNKKWRMLLFVSDNWNALFAGRHYPFFSKTIMQKIKDRWIEKTEDSYYRYSWGTPWSHWHNDQISMTSFREWKEDEEYMQNIYIPMRKDLYKLRKIITDKSNLHFNDLLKSSCYVPYYAWSNLSDAPIHFTIGEKVKCLQCNNEFLETSDSMSCENCLSEEGLIRCSDCGELIPKNRAIYISRDDRYVCESCLDNNYIECASCGEYVHKDDAYWDDERECYFCADCYYDIHGW